MALKEGAKGSVSICDSAPIVSPESSYRSNQTHTAKQCNNSTDLIQSGVPPTISMCVASSFFVIVPSKTDLNPKSVPQFSTIVKVVTGHRYFRGDSSVRVVIVHADENCQAAAESFQAFR
jgi:hypothetical protein